MGSANAADDSSGKFFQDISKVASQIVKKSTSGVTDGLYTAGMSYAGKMVPMALGLGGSLALCYLFVQMIKMMSGRGGNVVEIVFDIGIPIAIAAALINGYPERMGQLNSFLDLIRNVAPDPVSGIANFYGQVLTLIEKSVTAAVSVMHATSIWDDSFPTKLLDVFATLVFSIVIIFIVLSGLAEVLGLILLGPFLFAVGVAFGPVFIATIVVPWTRDYFGKWIGFVIGAALLTGVIGVVIGIAATCLGNLNIMGYATDAPISITLATSGIMIMAVNSLIAQAPAIASAMIPGTIGASKGSGDAVGKAAQSSIAKATSPATKGFGFAKGAVNKIMGSKGAAPGATPNIGSKLP